MQRRSRLQAASDPGTMPWRAIASSAYLEQLGSSRQRRLDRGAIQR
ncbi:MAG TPA: hypothetical protein VMS11_09900 [Solirubrobacterales bacterium]|nr:hypothetical protein [Solirubrobacterales bacterium]